MPDGETFGTWVGEQETIKDDFDSQLGDRHDYSRSRMVKEAMRLYLTVDSTLDEIEYTFPNERAKRSFVRQALLTQARIERERDE